MSGFLEAMFAEMGARRRRMRDAFGDRGQAVLAFLVMSGIVLGSLGLFVLPWMLAAAPWGFAAPVLYVAGYLLIELRRQGEPPRSEERDADGERPGSKFDWAVVLWGLACSALGAAAFMIAIGAQPAEPAAEDEWTPPESAIESTITPEY